MIAGGRSSRFGGDKGVALLGGVPLIDHAVAAIAPLTDAVVVCGRAWVGMVSLADRPRPGLGPLGGIAAALAHAEAAGFGRVLTVGCDMPGVSGALLRALLDAAPAWCRDAPILGCFPASAGGALNRLLDLPLDVGAAKQRHLSIRRWAESIGATAIASPTPLANVNTPADLADL